ncbi:hypothetical protein L207DRAFT_83551 [Hyaloscypha variabilis F]|uniref:Uncharacterized protein n=1 Tax=Hyaloscypha variabilis (strain UAMH 11265 / GT02V1 / F) TaxID=1149755 RepID=A0A2J6RDD5_HYAVF|nr:hypothetical protein L207DRAFT_83551 [Hyaloscypha variabilis F]
MRTISALASGEEIAFITYYIAVLCSYYLSTKMTCRFSRILLEGRFCIQCVSRSACGRGLFLSVGITCVAPPCSPS